MKALNEEEDYSIPMTPMIDIVFQLLIFFLLATTIQEEEIDIQINLPQGTQGAPSGAAGGARLVIGVRKDGSVTLSGTPIEWSDLRKRVIDAGRAKDKPQVHIRADHEATHGKIYKVYQICLEAGLTKLNDAGILEGGTPGP